MWESGCEMRAERVFNQGCIIAVTIYFFVRKMLDQEGLTDCKIIVSNSLDEHTISSLNVQKACIP